MKRMKFYSFGAITILVLVLVIPSYAQSNIVKQNSNVDITVELCGLPHKSSMTVTLSSSQLIELETYLNTIKERLKKVTSNREAIAIYSSLFGTLKKYNLLPDDTVSTLLLSSIIVRLALSNKITAGSDDHTNNWCSVIGHGSDLEVLGKLWVGNYDPYVGDAFYPCPGWVWSKGQQGIIYKEGDLWGQLGMDWINRPDDSFEINYLGGRGFIGIWLYKTFWIPSINFYFGIARQIGIDTHWPGW